MLDKRAWNERCELLTKCGRALRRSLYGGEFVTGNAGSEEEGERFSGGAIAGIERLVYW